MKIKLLILAVVAFFIVSCGGEVKTDQKDAPKEVVETKTIDPMTDKGIGPISSVTLGEIDPVLAETGQGVFKAKCSACHKMSKRFVGPALAGVTEKRTPEWIMNMILNPEVMVAKNEQAKQLLAEYLSPMANQNLTEEEARAILEYFRTVPAK